MMALVAKFDEKTNVWLEKKPSRFAIEIDGVCKNAGCDSRSISQEDFVNLLCELQKRFGCKVFGIQHHGEPLDKEECAKRLEKEKEPFRRFELEHGLKPYHFHLVLMLKRGVRNGTMAKYICDELGVPFEIYDDDRLMVNPFLHMEEAHDDCIGIIRYLCHVDNPEKKLFNVEEVITNDPKYLRFCMECENGIVNGTSLMRIIAICEGQKSAIMDMVGLQFYNRFRWSIVDLIKEGSWKEITFN